MCRLRRRRVVDGVAVAVRAAASSGAGGGGGGFGAGVSADPTSASNPLDDHVPVDRFYDGLRQLHASPDVFLVDDFLTSEQCDTIVAAAERRDMNQSPVVYAGWTNDVSDVVTNAARGPALWAAALSMLSGAASTGPGPGILAEGAVAYAVVVLLAGAGAGAWVKYREAQLRGMRTSTSCVLRGESAGERAYVRAAEALMPGSHRNTFEAPTVIRYEKGQRLAPHFDANRGAEVEDANRGGQTVATLLVYLTDGAGGEGGASHRTCSAHECHPVASSHLMKTQQKRTFHLTHFFLLRLTLCFFYTLRRRGYKRCAHAAVHVAPRFDAVHVHKRSRRRKKRREKTGSSCAD